MSLPQENALWEQYQRKLAEMPPDVAMEHVINNIGRFAKEHGLTAKQVQTCFEVGCEAAQLFSALVLT